MSKIQPSLKAASEVKGDDSISKSVPTFMVDPRIIVVQEGFNARPIYQDHVDYFKNLIREGVDVGYFVLQMIDGKPTVREGHHRREAYLQLIAEGLDIKRVKAIEFKGDEKDAIFLMLGTQSGRQYTPLQVGEQYIKLVNTFGMSYKEIAAKRGMSEQHVKDAIRLTEQPTELKEMIKAGQVAPATALKLVKSEGSSEAIKTLKQAASTPGVKVNKPITQKVLNSLGSGLVKEAARNKSECEKHLAAVIDSPAFDSSTKGAVREVLHLIAGKTSRIGASKKDTETAVNAFLEDNKTNPHSGVATAAHLLSDLLNRRFIAADNSPSARAYGHHVWLQDMAASHQKPTFRAAAHWFLAVLNSDRNGGEVAPAPAVLSLEEALKAEMESGGHVRAETLCPEHTALITYIRGRA